MLWLTGGSYLGQELKRAGRQHFAGFVGKKPSNICILENVGLISQNSHLYLFRERTASVLESKNNTTLPAKIEGGLSP